MASTCAGQMGQYLRINNPHKTSLYMACGIPIMVWKEAAIAEFIETNNLGILVDSLYDIGDKVNALSDDMYSTIREYIKVSGEKLSSDSFMASAINKVIKRIKG